MGVKVTYSNDAFPKGHPFYISGLDGELKNGETTEFSDEAVAQFEATQGMTIRAALKDSKDLTVESAKGGGE